MTVLLDAALPLARLARCPAYVPSPLRRLTLGGRVVLVKDESARMGLGAFKALGGPYAVLRLIEARLAAAGLSPAEHGPEAPAFRSAAAGMTFVCASAGNHGLAVAAGARLFGARARIHLARPVPEVFAERLRAKGAEVVRSGATYEDSVAAAAADAESSEAVHLPDGSWPGMTEAPRLVMEGYTVIAAELPAQLGGDWPSHVLVQAGVGGIAAAIAQVIRRDWPVQPEILVVEPEAARCLDASVSAGRLVTAAGPQSSMGRLDCKDASVLAFDILREADCRFVAVSDAEAEAAAGALGSMGLPTTPSGAAGAAALRVVPTGARPLIFVTEGPV